MATRTGSLTAQCACKRTFFLVGFPRSQRSLREPLLAKIYAKKAAGSVSDLASSEPLASLADAYRLTAQSVLTDNTGRTAHSDVLRERIQLRGCQPVSTTNIEQPATVPNGALLGALLNLTGLGIWVY